MKNMEKLYFDPIDLKSIKPAQDLAKSMKIEKRDIKLQYFPENVL